jgi:hypothetical protein
MNSKDKGNTTEAMILAALIRVDRNVLVPWGDNLRYDLAYDDNGQLIRVQCKTGRYRKGAVVFATCSSMAHRGKRARNYRGQADFFGVYCPQLRKTYLVPVNECGRRSCTLRLRAPKNKQITKVRLAADFEFAS